MKSILVLVVVFLMAFSASAQIEKGTILGGASSAFGFSNTAPKTGTSSSFVNLNLKAGYFFMENLVGGLNLNYNHFSSGSSSASGTLVGVFARYYYVGKIFGGLGVNAVSTSPGSTGTQVPLEVGYAAFIAKNIAVEPSLNFTMGSNSNVFGLNLGFSLYFNRP